MEDITDIHQLKAFEYYLASIKRVPALG